MPRIDLYLIKESHFTEQIEFCCRLLEKALQTHSRIHIQTQDSIQNEALNNALWSFKPESFLPHVVGQNDTEGTAIIIDSENLSPELMSDDALLVLLNKSLPDNFAKFKRLCLVVPNIEQEIQDARQLYKQLKSHGNEVHIHDLRIKA